MVQFTILEHSFAYLDTAGGAVVNDNNNNIVWQQNSTQPDNPEKLEAIARWWASLAGKEVAWQQRLIPADGNLESLDWQPQKFDEKLTLEAPQLRGITIYWRASQSGERNITASKLQLDLTRQRLYVFPQTQSQVVISVSLPKTQYQKLNLSNPQIAATIKDGKGIILLRDEAEQLEIKVTLDSARLNQLKDRLKIAHN